MPGSPRIVKDGTMTVAQYSALHYWVAKHLGKPKECWDCKDTSKTRYAWANKSGKYYKDLDDWERLCYSCHRLKDIAKFEAENPTERYGYAGRPFCARGHEMVGDNIKYKMMHGLGPYRFCHECHKIRCKLRYKKVKAGVL